jgi:hypothetical protein
MTEMIPGFRKQTIIRSNLDVALAKVRQPSLSILIPIVARSSNDDVAFASFGDSGELSLLRERICA